MNYMYISWTQKNTFSPLNSIPGASNWKAYSYTTEQSNDRTIDR